MHDFKSLLPTTSKLKPSMHMGDYLSNF